MKKVTVILLDKTKEKDEYGTYHDSFIEKKKLAGYLISHTSTTNSTTNNDNKRYRFKFITKDKIELAEQYIKYQSTIYKILPITNLYKKGYVFEVIDK